MGRAAVAVLAVAVALGAAAPTMAATGGVSATGGASAAASAGSLPGEEIAFTALRTAGATWYGPGFYGNRTACGVTLQTQTIGVAHRGLPCGTAVKFVYRGRSLVTRVIDRGPYAAGMDWDLTNGARRILHFEGSAKIRYAVEMRSARGR